jgi:hypothetical protein
MIRKLKLKKKRAEEIFPQPSLKLAKNDSMNELEKD